MDYAGDNGCAHPDCPAIDGFARAIRAGTTLPLTLEDFGLGGKTAWTDGEWFMSSTWSPSFPPDQVPLEIHDWNESDGNPVMPAIMSRNTLLTATALIPWNARGQTLGLRSTTQDYGLPNIQWRTQALYTTDPEATACVGSKEEFLIQLKNVNEVLLLPAVTEYLNELEKPEQFTMPGAVPSQSSHGWHHSAWTQSTNAW